MSFAARLFYNNQDWKQPVNVDINANRGKGYGVSVKTENYTYSFGFEEWINNAIPKKLKIGFLECYRQHAYPAIADKIMLYTRLNGEILHVGNLYQVEQMDANVIEEIRKTLTQLQWPGVIQEHFHQLNDPRSFNQHIEYQKHWQSNQIISTPSEPGFCFNIRYKKLEIFDKRSYVNLSAKDNQNTFFHNWHHLGIRYIVDNLTNKLDQSNPLKRYLLEM